MALLTAADVSKKFGINMKSAYDIVNQLNEELKQKGYLTIPHRIPEKYLMERFYQ